MKPLLITIDGPAGAGKTTLSRMLADRLGYTYVDTGALYRGVAYEARGRNIDPEDETGLRTLCSTLQLNFERTSQGRRLISNGKDISDLIRTPEITMMASAVSAKPVIRECLLGLQRRLGRDKRAVFEGRDMGTVVFPDADVKFFLDASPRQRALRRYREFLSTSEQTLEEVEKDMRRRDENDSRRAIAPLKPAPDAVRLDSTDLDIEGVLQQMMKVIEAMALN